MNTVVYASNNKFFPILGASIASLLEHNENYQIVILSDKVSQENIDKLQKYVQDHNSCLKIIDINDAVLKRFENLRITENWPLIAFVRLHIEQIIDESIEKVLYLDCDTIINSSLDELFEIDMDGYYCCGVIDCVDNEYRRRIGLKNNDVYVNSGVILYDLKNIRESDISPKIDLLMQTNALLYKYPDQDLINVTYKGHIRELPLKYNVLAQIYAFYRESYMKYRKSNIYYEKAEYNSARVKPCIVHFATGFTFARPWFKNSKHVYTKLFRSNYEKINGPLEFWGDDNRTSKQIMTWRIYRLMPRLSINILMLLRKINNR